MPPKSELPPLRPFSPLNVEFKTAPTSDAEPPLREKSPAPSSRRSSFDGMPERRESVSSSRPLLSPVRGDPPSFPPDEPESSAGRPPLRSKTSVSRLKKKFSESTLVERYKRGKELAADPESQEWIDMGKSLRARGLNEKLKIPMPVAKMVAEMTMTPVPVVSNLTHFPEKLRNEILARNDRVAKKAGPAAAAGVAPFDDRLEATVHPGAQKREFGYAGESVLDSSGSAPQEQPSSPFQPSHGRQATRSTVTREDVQLALLACIRGAGSVEGPYASSLHFSSSDDEAARNDAAEGKSRPARPGELERTTTAEKLEAHTTAIEDGLFSGVTADEVFQRLQGIEDLVKAESVSSGQFEGAFYAIDRALGNEEDAAELREKLNELADLFNGKRAAPTS